MVELEAHSPLPVSSTVAPSLAVELLDVTRIMLTTPVWPFYPPRPGLKD